MRTLSEIIEITKDGGRPEYDELRYALVAMCALKHFDFEAIKKLYQAKKKGITPFLSYDAEWQMEESFKRFKTALGVDPKTYCGPSHDPDREEYQRFRRAGKKLLAMAEKKLQEAK